MNAELIAEEIIKPYRNQPVTWHDLIASFATALQAAKEQGRQEVSADKQHEEWMASQLCAVEDALGCANDYDPKTGLVDTHSKVLERILDLIAAEGEIGDLREQLKAEREAARAVIAPFAKYLKSFTKPEDDCPMFDECKAAKQWLERQGK